MPSLPTILHLTASPCFGGPERQMLELGRELKPEYRSVYVTFREEDRCWDFVRHAGDAGYEALVIQHDTPRLVAMFRELLQLLERFDASVLVCHGYKAGIIGRLAARRAGVPAFAVSRGWTGESRRVRLFDWLDRVNLRWMHHVVCVSRSQANKLRRAGVPERKITVIHNAIRTERFAAPPDPAYRERLEALFPVPPTEILGAAGRLSPEKGFDILIQACQQLPEHNIGDFGLALFGDGPLRGSLQKQIDDAGLGEQIVLAGFTSELDRFMPHFDVFVQSSHTEGLPNVLLEAAAAGVPIVATEVGGTAEMIDDGSNGWLVPPGNPVALAQRIVQLLGDQQQRQQMGRFGQQKCRRDFSFTTQASAYQNVLRQLSLVR